MGGTFLYEHTPEATTNISEYLATLLATLTTNITGMMIVTAAMLIVQLGGIMRVTQG